MKHRYLLIIVALIGILLLNAHTLCAQQPVPSVQWERFYGGTEDDIAYSIQQTFDGGYIVAGTTQSWNGDVAGLHGNTTYDAPDYWVLKLNAIGKIQWKQCYGGGNYDYAYSIQQTMDSGYIVGGSTSSSDGDVGGNYGFGYDYWIVKLNQTGNIQWQTPLGGNDGDNLTCVRQTDDGGYIAAGSSASISGEVTGNHGGWDYWIVKLSFNGNLEWEHSYGGSGNDEAQNILQTSDGGYIVAGSSNSVDGDVTGNHGNDDYWIVKLSSKGNIQWQKSLGGRANDEADYIQKTADGGYIVSGVSNSNDGNVTNNPNNDGMWLVKLDSLGNVQWQKIYSTGDPYHILQTSDKGYLFGGGSSIMKIDTSGTLQWQEMLTDTTYNGFIYDIQQTNDDSYVVAGYGETDYFNYFNTGYHGHDDFWVEKLGSPMELCINTSPIIAPNTVLNATINLQSNVIAPLDSITFDLQYDPTAFALDSITTSLCKLSVQNISLGLVHVTLQACALPLQQGGLCTALFTPLVSSRDTTYATLNIDSIVEFPPDSVLSSGCSASVTILPLCGLHGVIYTGATSLAQNYPNPFAGTTAIHVTLSQNDAQSARLVVCNVLGEQVADLTSELSTDGNVTFNAGANKAGVYYYILQTASGRMTRQMFVVK